MQLDFSENIRKLASIFRKNGYELYPVGGVVRDSLLGLKTSDVDFCTSATPDEMLKMFPYAIKTGIKHGTLTIPFKGEHYEVTTYRIDGKYSDNRHPENVEFSQSLKEDLSRRDFTINAMAYDTEKDTVIDLYGSIKDLNEKIIRSVGDPNERFKEDALRMLRAIRFSSRLGFRIEKETFNAIQKFSKNIENISKERIKTEVFGILESAFFKDGIKDLCKTNLYEHIFPYLERPKEAKIETLDIKGKGIAILRFVELLYIAKANIEESEKTLSLLKCSNKEKEDIIHLYKCILVDIHTMKTPYRKRNFLSLLGREYFENYFEILRELNLPSKNDKEKYKALLSSPLTIGELKINGDDLKSIGIEGKEIRNALQKCLSLVLENPESNTKETLIDFVKNGCVSSVLNKC